MAKEFELKALILGVDKLSPMLGKLNKNVRGWRRQMKQASEGALVSAAALAAGLAVPATAFANAEDAAIGLKVAMMGIGGNVGPEFDKISALAERLGNKLPGDTAGFQNMMTMLVRQGISAKAILGGMGEATAYLSVQLKKTPEDAAEFAAKLQDATRTAEGDMMGLMDVIQRAFYLGVDDGNMLAAFTKLGPAMDMVRQKGLAGAQAFAPLVVMMDQAGMSGEASGNAIRKMFQSGFDTKKLGKANGMLEDLGLRLDFMDGNGEFAGMDNLFAQLDKLKKLSTGQRVNVLTTLFGDDAETLSVVSTLIDKGAAGYAEVQARMQRQADLQKRVNAQLGTLKNLWDAAVGTFTNGLVAIGETYAPELKKLSEFMGTMSEKLGAFAKEHPGAIKGLIGIAAGLVLFKVGALAAATAMGIFNAVMMMSPLGIALRLLALAVGLIIANWDHLGKYVKMFFNWSPIGLLIKNWGPVSEFFVSLWGALKTGASAAWSVIKFLFNWSPLGLIIKNWEPLVAFFKGLWDRIKPFVEPIIAAHKFAFDKVAGMFGFGGGEGAPAKPLPAAAQRQNLNGEMVVRFENAPPGMRASQGKTSQPGVGFNPDVGYRSFAMGMP
jgi:TP901 family phage tail tape measure protein